MTLLAQYIETFKQKYPQYKNKNIEAYAFGDGTEMANELAKLVSKQEKCGTTSLYQLYELENQPLPQSNELFVILDGQGNPTSVIKNTAVDIMKFREVTDHHAMLEGEGDKSLAYWRKAHLDFFNDAIKDLGNVTFTEDSLVVFETFELLDGE